MLGRFEKTSLNECISQLKEGIENNDDEKLYQGYHTLKSASGYIGAGKVHFACYFIQEAQRLKDTEKLMFSYQLLLEICIEFRFYTKKFIAEYMNEPYIESSSARDIAIVKGYKMELDPETSKFFVLKEG